MKKEEKKITVASFTTALNDKEIEKVEGGFPTVCS